MSAVTHTGKQSRAEAKRESILEAAIAVFSQGGFDASSMDMVAERAGASKRTVYNYFPSKDALLAAIADRFAREMRELKDIAYEPMASLEAQLGRFVAAEIEVVRNERWMGMVRLLVAAFTRSPDLARATISRTQVKGDPLVEWVSSAVRDGKLAAPVPELAAAVFRAMLGGAYTWPAVYGGGVGLEPSDSLRRELIETFLCRYRPSRLS